MPGFEPDTQSVVLRVTKVDITQSGHLFIHIGTTKTGGEIGGAKTDLTYIKITNPMKRITRRGNGPGGQG